MPSGHISASTGASSFVGDSTFEILEFPVATLRPGTNVLAVELHQEATNSSDVVFGIALSAIGLRDDYLKFTRHPTNVTRYEGESAVFEAAVEGVGDFWVQWFKDGALLPGETNTTLYVENISSLQGGTYYLKVTNAFTQVESEHAGLNVLPGLTPS